jgi:hypothetical protein
VALATLVFAEITTISLQRQGVQRWTLAREPVEVETPYGIVGVKVARSRYRAERVWLSSLGVQLHGSLTAELLCSRYDFASALPPAWFQVTGDEFAKVHTLNCNVAYCSKVGYNNKQFG